MVRIAIVIRVGAVWVVGRISVLRVAVSVAHGSLVDSGGVNSWYVSGVASVVGRSVVGAIVRTIAGVWVV